ncbi:HPr(Ser) kinase/phosphatase [bacterium]|nr:HPr(Ser) kinase/phosphatase [bacterium]
MPKTVFYTLYDLLKNTQLELSLENMSEEEMKKIELTESKVQVVGLSIAGFVAYLYKNRIQLFGKSENDYLRTLPMEEQLRKTETFLKEKPILVIFTHPEKPTDYFKETARKYNVPLMSTTMISSVFTDYIRDILNTALAPTVSLHAQLIDVLSVGMLIMGESGVGKSETSLDLVMRGHKLIADDFVEIRRLSPNRLIGSCNEIGRNFIEIRGIGLVDLQQMFGITSVAPEKEIDCVVRLVSWDDIHNFDYERVGDKINYYEILGIKKAYYIIPVRNGSNLSSLMEAIARDYLLKKMGFFAAQEMEKRLDDKLKGLMGK